MVVDHDRQLGCQIANELHNKVGSDKNVMRVVKLS